MRSSALPTVLSLGIAPVLIAFGSSSARSIAAAEPPSSAAKCRDASQVLDDLVDGSIADVWELVESGELPDFDAIGDVEVETCSACRDVLLEKLTKALSRTDDDRIVTRILDELDFEDAPLLVPALQRALAHESTDVRLHALRAV